MHAAHGRAGRIAQHFPVEHPGPAHLVRSAHLRRELARAARRRRSDGRDEPADLGQGCRLHRSRRLPALRFDQAVAAVEVPRGHQFDRRAADGNLQPHLHRSAPAPAVQEHHLYRRAGVAALDRTQSRRRRDCGAVPGQGKAHCAEREGVPARLRLRRRTSGRRLRTQARALE
jgi:hypothetical protein